MKPKVRKIYPKVLALLAIPFILSGCAKNVSNPDRDTSSGITPNLLSTSNLGNGDYFYIVDKNTGVVYLGYNSVHRYGISVMLNRDGTPVTAEQLEIEY